MRESSFVRGLPSRGLIATFQTDDTTSRGSRVSKIRLHLLGGVEVKCVTNDVERTITLQSKRTAILAYLAMAKKSPYQRRDSVIGMFWPELSQDRARAALRKALHSLRASIGPHFITSKGDEEIGLAHDCVECDASAFLHRFQTGDLEGAMDLYHGDFLPGFHLPDSPRFELWADGERTRLRAAAAGACIQLAERAEARGNVSKAVHWARHAEVLFPQREEIGRLLMSMLAASGDRSAALTKYAEVRNYLAREFHAEPSPETEALVAEIRSETSLSRRLTPSHARPALESDDFFRQLVETVSDVIYCCDAEGRFTYANAAGSRLLGLPEKEIVGRSYLEFVREDHRDNVLEFYLRQMHDRTPLTYLEYPIVRSDGSSVWLGQNVQLVQKDGEVVGIQAVARDVTARRKADKVAGGNKPNLRVG